MFQRIRTSWWNWGFVTVHLSKAAGTVLRGTTSGLSQEIRGTWGDLTESPQPLRQLA
jgi:hypothetical protein